MEKMKLTKKVIVGVVLAILLFNTITTRNEIEGLRDDMNNMNSHLSSLNSNINSLSSSIYREQDKDKMIEDISYDFEVVGDHKVKVNLKAQFQKLSKNSKVIFAYKERIGNDKGQYESSVLTLVGSEANSIPKDEWKEIVLKPAGTMTYIGSFIGDDFFDYDAKIIVEYENYTQLEEVSYVNLYYRYYPQITGHINSRSIDTTGNIKFNVVVEFFRENYNQTNKNEEIASVICNVYLNDESIYEFDLLKDDDIQIMNHGDLTMYHLDEKVVKYKNKMNNSMSIDNISYGMTLKTKEGLIFEGNWKH